MSSREVFDALQGSASYCQLLLVMCGNNILLLPFLAKAEEGEGTIRELTRCRVGRPGAAVLLGRSAAAGRA